MDWKDGLTAAVVVGLGYWGIKSITKGDEDIPDAVCIHCGSIEIGGGGGVCIDCGRHPFNYGRAITAKEDDGYSDNSNTVFDAEDKKDPYEEYMELGEERIERTSDAWDEIAERFFEENGWTKSHMAYDTDRETNTLWVETEEGWEDTDIPAKKGEWLLTDMWDEAEWMGYQEWCKYEGKGEWDNDCSDKPYEHSTAHDDWAIVKDLTNLHDWTSSWDYPMFDYCGNCGQYYSPETGIVTDEEYQDLIHGANAESFSAETNYCYGCGLLARYVPNQSLEEIEVWDREMRRDKKAYSCSDCYDDLVYGAESFSALEGQRIPNLTMEEWNGVSKALGEVGTFHNWIHEGTDGEGGDGTTLVVNKRHGVFGRRNTYVCDGCGNAYSPSQFPGGFRKHEPESLCEYCEDKFNYSED